MGEVVNLNRVRKAKTHVAREAEAAANRAKFGRSKAARDGEAAEEARRDHLLDGARRADDD